MAITTYSELQTAVGNWLQRSDLSSRITEFIANAEAEFNRTLRLTGQLTRAELTADARWESISGLTAELAEIRSIAVTSGGTRYPLEYVAPDASQTFYTSGTPKFYTRLGAEIGVFPPPSGSYTLEIIYWRTIPALSGSNTTNFLLTLAPDLYLYRSVMEGAQYVHADGLLSRVAPMYDRALAQVMSDDKRRQYGATAPAVRLG